MCSLPHVLRVVAVSLAGVICASCAQPQPKPECDSNDDCKRGEECNTGICRAEARRQAKLPAGCYYAGTQTSPRTSRDQTIMLVDEGLVRVPLKREHHQHIATSLKALLYAELWQRRARHQGNERHQVDFRRFTQAFHSVEVVFKRSGPRTIFYYDGYLHTGDGQPPACLARHRNLTYEIGEPVLANFLKPGETSFANGFVVEGDQGTHRISFISQEVECHAGVPGPPELPDGLTVDGVLEAIRKQVEIEQGTWKVDPRPQDLADPGHPCPNFDRDIGYLRPLPEWGSQHPETPWVAD